MQSRRILIIVLAGLVIMAHVNSQPTTYRVNVYKISQPDARSPVDAGLLRAGDLYLTFSGAPLLVEFAASGFHCPNQDLSFMISYVYRRVRPANFLEDPSLYVMEGYMTTTTVISETCAASWTSPGMRDGIHTVGILAFDGSGAQSSWYYVTVIKNNERSGGVSYFPGGSQNSGTTSEEPPISKSPVVIIDTPSQTLTSGEHPIQYVDIHFHTAYPFLVEYFLVQWTFTSQTECKYSSSAIVYPTGFNEGFFRLDMSSVFASEWDEPIDEYGKCKFGSGEFEIDISCKTANGMGPVSSVTITLA